MEIPTRYNPQEVESKIYERWLAEHYFHATPNLKKEPFTIVIPPPNITGILHMGHALNNTIQDVLVRFRRMQGYEALWMPGTDHAGIATQNVVEKDLAKEGLRKDDIGRAKFEERLRQWTNKYGSTILGQLKKLGASCDWDRTRFTLDDDYSEAVKEAFVRLYEKGLIYQGEYIINWCPRCKTALSDEEAPRKEINGWLYHIKYPIVRDAKVIGYTIVATTRPETMLGDTAIAINPHDERHSHLKGARIVLPIMERELKVIEDDLIDKEFGTGVVKVTPAHDPVDFALAKKYNLPFINIMNDDATLNAQAGDFCGMDRFKAREALLTVLEEKKLIEKKEPYKISAGHCYRCHTIIEPRLSLQWFVHTKPLAQPAIAAVNENKITFYPERWKKVYLNWMNNIQDWCISRQIWWGHQLPVYYCKNCYRPEGRGLASRPEGHGFASNGESRGQSHRPQTAGSELQAAGYRLQAGNKSGASSLEPRSTKGIIVSKTKPASCPDCRGSEIVQDTDVLDTWFSSWLWPFATFYWPNFSPQSRVDSPQTDHKKELEYFYPTNVLVTASEILFFWVARMIMAGLEFKKEIPFKDVIIHGTVRDEQGVKMSKSLGNIIDPLAIIDKFGADPLRFSLMLTAASGSDVYLSDEKFLVGRNFCNKIWNATRFLFLKIQEQGLHVDDFKLTTLDEIDTWLLAELNQTIAEVTKHLAQYRINDATKTIYEFFWHTFCDWYIEMIKDNFTADRAKTTFYTLTASLKILHPLMPFITEEIFQLIRANTGIQLGETIMTCSWPAPSNISGHPALANLAALIATIKDIRTIKADLGLGTKKIGLEVAADEQLCAFWQKNEAWINRLAGLTNISFKKPLTRTLYKAERWDINFTTAELDTQNLLTSVQKKLNETNTILERVTERLSNENFLKNAAVETIEEEKEKAKTLAAGTKRLEELCHALKSRN